MEREMKEQGLKERCNILEETVGRAWMNLYNMKRWLNLHPCGNDDIDKTIEYAEQLALVVNTMIKDLIEKVEDSD